MDGFLCRSCNGRVRDNDKFCPDCGVRAPASNNPLSALNISPQSSKQPRRKVPRENQGVISGAFACLFGVLGIFTLGVIFVPIAALFALDGISRGINGNGTGVLVSLAGGVLTAIGFITSPTLWVLTAGLLASQQHHEFSAASAATRPVTGTTILTLDSVKAYDGLWVQKDAECQDENGQTRTLIASNNMINGKSVFLFDQYENHCLIEDKAASPDSVKLFGTCYEFWEDFTKKQNGQKTTIKLTRIANGITIDGDVYNRCEIGSGIKGH